MCILPFPVYVCTRKEGEYGFKNSAHSQANIEECAESQGQCYDKQTGHIPHGGGSGGGELYMRIHLCPLKHIHLNAF